MSFRSYQPREYKMRSCAFSGSMSFTAMSAFRLQVQTGFNLRVRGDIRTCAQDKTCVPASVLPCAPPKSPPSQKKKKKYNKLCNKFISAL